ncbi:hypothetical protein D3C75_716050 [compost metagenome]
MCHNPTDSILYSLQFTLIACQQCGNVCGVNQAGCNISASYQFDTCGFVYLLISCTVSEEPDG